MVLNKAMTPPPEQKELKACNKHKNCYNSDVKHYIDLRVLMEDFKKAFTLAEGATHVDMANNVRQLAFTLAEVLITLGVIGIVASMTLPSLIQNHKNKVNATKLKKTYNVLENALKRAEVENGPMVNWDLADGENFTKNYIAPYVQYHAYYKNNNTYYISEMCHEEGQKGRAYKWMNGVGMSGPVADHISAIKLNNGACIGFNSLSGTADFNRLIYIDTNGNENLPNKAGEDLFIYYLDNKYFVKPYGNNRNLSNDDLINPSKQGACNKKSPGGGYFCAEKIMRDNWEIKY